MALLLQYLKKHWSYVLLALFLAAVNQIFSLLDPLIFRLHHRRIRHEISSVHDTPVSEWREPATGRRRRCGIYFAACEEFSGLLCQCRHPANRRQLYADGVERSLSLPYAVFEDQRSGETLGKLQKVRNDVERFINVFRQRPVHFGDRHRVCDRLCAEGQLDHRARLSAHRSGARWHQFRPEPKDQAYSENHRSRNSGAGWARPPNRFAISSS